MSSLVDSALRLTAKYYRRTRWLPGEHHLRTLVRLTLNPGIRYAELASAFANHAFGHDHKPTIMDSTEALPETLKAAESGDKRFASRMLAAQAVSLDAIFTELARRSGRNMGDYMDAADQRGVPADCAAG